MKFEFTFKNKKFNLNRTILNEDIVGFFAYKNLPAGLVEFYNEDVLSNDLDFINWYIEEKLLPPIENSYNEMLANINKEIWDFCYNTSSWYCEADIKKFIISLKYSQKYSDFDFDWINIYNTFYKNFCEKKGGIE